MKVTNENIIVYDIETIKGDFLYSAYDPCLEEWYDFHINLYTNDLDKLLKFLENHSEHYHIGFNNINFDSQIMDFIWRNQNRLLQEDSKTVREEIWQFAQDVIEATNHGGFPPYREENLTFRQIDVFKIQHFDNKNRMVSLKRVEFETDAEDVRELPVPHDKIFFTKEEVKELTDYCHNDVYQTYVNYLYITGDCDNELYQGMNEVLLREQLSEKFGINCLNYSNSKYGDEIGKKEYAKELGIDIKDLPRKGTFRKNLYFKSCIPNFVKFKTDKLQKFLENLRKTVIGVKDDYDETLVIGNTKHTFALGGIHSDFQNKIYESDEEYDLVDWDVRGYYVWTMISQRIAPKHLNANAFLKTIEYFYTERAKLKPLVKQHSEYKSLVQGFKEAAVCAYGHSGDPNNWKYDPQMRLHICIAGQVSILMLIESLELAGFETFFSNTKQNWCCKIGLTQGNSLEL